MGAILAAAVVGCAGEGGLAGALAEKDFETTRRFDDWTLGCASRERCLAFSDSGEARALLAGADALSLSFELPGATEGDGPAALRLSDGSEVALRLVCLQAAGCKAFLEGEDEVVGRLLRVTSAELVLGPADARRSLPLPLDGYAPARAEVEKAVLAYRTEKGWDDNPTAFEAREMQ